MHIHSEQAVVVHTCHEHRYRPSPVPQSGTGKKGRGCLHWRVQESTSSPTNISSRRRVWSQMKRFVSLAAIAIPHKINICVHVPLAGQVQLACFQCAWGWQVTKTVDMVRAKLLLGKLIPDNPLHCHQLLYIAKYLTLHQSWPHSQPDLSPVEQSPKENSVELSAKTTLRKENTYIKYH